MRERRNRAVANLKAARMLRMTDLPLAGRRVLIREDLNVPIKDGEVASDARLAAALPTVNCALEQGARVILLSHLGRPEEGRFDESFSLEPVARRLGELLHRPVPLVKSWERGVEVEPGQSALLENVRFERGEKTDDPELAARLAGLCDIFVMDAFGAAHRAHASTHGVARLAPVACAGPLLVKELESLATGLEQPCEPIVAIVGGSKISTKLGVLEKLVDTVDTIIPGGGIANTLLAAAGYPVGRSLHEPGMLRSARRLMRRRIGDAHIDLPFDVVVAEALGVPGRRTVREATQVGRNEMIFDIGPRAIESYELDLHYAGTILWNGPVGVFEQSEFAHGTEAIARAVAASDAFSIAGGGETLAAIQQFGVGEGISYQSTGGGAFLEILEGKELPAVAVLEARASV